MGLSASMWTGVAGLTAHGESMSVLGNNIANVNTIGYKGGRIFFEDFISQDLNTAAGVAQVGRGVGIGAVYGDFSQGAFETTNEATDLAIGGRGFFQVKVLGGKVMAFPHRRGDDRGEAYARPTGRAAVVLSDQYGQDHGRRRGHGRAEEANPPAPASRGRDRQGLDR